MASEPFHLSARQVPTDAELIAAQLERRVAVRRAELCAVVRHLELASRYRRAPGRPLLRRASKVVPAAAAILGAAGGAIACFLMMPVVAAYLVLAFAVTTSGWIAVRHRTLTGAATGVAVGMLLGALVARWS